MKETFGKGVTQGAPGWVEAEARYFPHMILTIPMRVCVCWRECVDGGGMTRAHVRVGGKARVLEVAIGRHARWSGAVRT